MNPIIFIVAWIATLTMTLVTFVLELPLKAICAIISIVFLLIVAFTSPLLDKNINVSDKVENFIENFVKYGLYASKWLFVKTFKKYKYLLL
jgi:hypothetical protein